MGVGPQQTKRISLMDDRNGTEKVHRERIEKQVQAAVADLGSTGQPILPPHSAWLSAEPEGPALAGLIDHTLLKPEAGPEAVDRACDEGLQYGFASVVVNPIFVPQIASRFEGTSVLPASVVGFPLGGEFTPIKREQARQLIAAGARELDMVLPVGLLLAGHYRQVAQDMLAVVEVCHAEGVLIKVILETGLLDQRAKIAGTLLACEVGADFVKTCTGFGPGGATEEDIRLMRSLVGARMGVKAAGGVRSLEGMKATIRAGASRIGATRGPAIMEQGLEG